MARRAASNRRRCKASRRRATARRRRPSTGLRSSRSSPYQLFASGNFYDSNTNGVLDGRLLGQGDFGSVTWHETPSVAFPDVPALTAEEAFRFVSEHAGASLFRDAVDDYLLTELASLGPRGATISDETRVGLPNVVGELPVAQAPADSDRDGMPDAWEQQNG